MTAAADHRDTTVTTALCPEHAGQRHQVLTDGANLLSCAEPLQCHDAGLGFECEGEVRAGEGTLPRCGDHRALERSMT